ncbi:hypothetical protein [Paraburkholderia sp.]|uniref:hypothetical protein n=1 Tax=Paraburkholderia sp. TaxID=1926495 RepID=UPI0039E2851A
MTVPIYKSPYPALEVITKHGNLIAIIAGLLPLVAGVWAWLATTAWWPLVAAIIAAPILWFIVRSYVELVRVLSDMLLPK